MKSIKKLSGLLEYVKSEDTPRVAVAAGEDPDTILAVAHAVDEGVVKATLVGDRKSILKVIRKNNLKISSFQINHVQDPEEATVEAVRMVKNNEAEILMKGQVKTSTFMKAVLDRGKGLMPKGGLLSHVALMEIPAYHKLLIITDAAIIPSPDMDQKVTILHFATEVAYALGIEKPKAALISATETISFKVQSSVDAAVITAMSQRKQIQGVTVDGPLALDVSLSKKHCEIKGLESPINGDADILIFPNIETANTFYKSTTLLANSLAASMVVGTEAPVILTSRADEDDTKFYSIVLAARVAAKRFFE